LKSVTQLKSLGDIRTTISTHARSVPRHKGSTYLEILSRGLEKQRLDSEQDWMARRQGRIDKRLQEIRELMNLLLAKVDQEINEIDSPGSIEGRPAAAGNGTHPPGWKKLTIHY